MPYSLPRNRTQQAAYNRQLQERFQSTHRVAAPRPAAAQRDPIAQLKDLAALQESGALTDAEFASAKADLLGR